MATRSPINVPVLRYTDVLMMYAEALMNGSAGPGGRSGEHREFQVRRRSWSAGIKSFTITSGGSGYTTAPTVTISGNGGASAKAVIKNGAVTGIVLDRDPSGITYALAGKYTTAPTVTISGDGSGAQATAEIFKPEDADVKPAFTASKEAFRRFIQDERMREFNFENMRRADLVR